MIRKKGLFTFFCIIVDFFVIGLIFIIKKYEKNLQKSIRRDQEKDCGWGEEFLCQQEY